MTSRHRTGWAVLAFYIVLGVTLLHAGLATSAILPPLEATVWRIAAIVGGLAVISLPAYKDSRARATVTGLAAFAILTRAAVLFNAGDGLIVGAGLWLTAIVALYAIVVTDADQPPA